MKKRVLSAFMALALCLTLLPAPALAEETENNVAVQENTANVAEVTIDGTTTQYTNIVNAFADAQEAESASVKLLTNVTIPKDDHDYSYGIQLTGGNITLDLNGCTIQTTGGESGFLPLYAVFYIENGSSLAVQDKSTNGGKIVQPNGGQAIHVGSNGTLTVESGAIEVTSNDESSSSYITTQNCAIFLNGGGTANILGGTLTGKQGIYVKNGTLNVSGGTIRGKNSYALQVAQDAVTTYKSSVTLTGGSYTTGVSNGCSIYNADGAAASLLASGYRFQSDGIKSEYSTDGQGVVGNTAVAERPANEFSYVDENGKEQTQANCTPLTADGFQGVLAGNETWFAANTSFTADDPLQVLGTVNLILCDGVTVTLNKGISLSGSEDQPGTLNIYAQSGGTGKLICGGASNSTNAGIYISTGTACTTALNIYGGDITATGSFQAGMSADACGAGIGTSANDKNGSTMTVNIFGGTVTAMSGGEGAQAIGNGTNAKGTVTVNIAPGMKCVRTDDLNTECAPGNTDGTSVTVTKCENHVWKYTYTEDSSTHTKTCTLCHTVGESEAHSPAKYVFVDDSQHNEVCVCGKTIATVGHAMQCTPNADGLTHRTKCKYCDLTSVDQPHTFQDGACTACQIRKAAEYNGQQYAFLQAAINAAAADGGTVTLARDVPENVTVTGGTLTVDLNGKTWLADISKNPDIWGRIPLTVTGGSVTLENGTLDQGWTTSAGSYGIRIQGGSVTVKGNAVVIGSNTTGSGANISYPAIRLESGGALTLETGAALVHGLEVPEGKHLSDYLPAGTAFGLRSYDEATKTWTAGDGLLANAYTINVYNVPNMALVVVEHSAHDFKLNSDGKYTCACGYVCPHNEFKDGKCTICGNGCAHTDVDENGVCENCKTQMAAKIEAGGKTTYSTDFKAALDSAADGTKITLLANAAVGNVYLRDKTVTLDLNGKTVKNSGGGSKLIEIGSSNSSANLIITGSGSFTSADQPLVVKNGTLDLSRWTGDNSYIYRVTLSGANSQLISPTGAGQIDRLAFIDSDTEQAADTASLNGGRYGKIVYKRGNTIKLGDLLAEGYAFRQNGTFLEYARELKNNDTVEEVEVVRCTSHVDANGDKRCDYCNTDLATGMVATSETGGTTYYHTDLSAALAKVSTDGGTVKLINDVTAPDPLSIVNAKDLAITLDLNGHTLSGSGDSVSHTFLQVLGNVTICDSSDAKSGKIGSSTSGGVCVSSGTLTITGGTFDCLVVVGNGGNMKISGGIFAALETRNYTAIRTLLADGYGLKRSDGSWLTEENLTGTTAAQVTAVQAPLTSVAISVTPGTTVEYGQSVKLNLEYTTNPTGISVDHKWYSVDETDIATEITDAKDTEYTPTNLSVGEHKYRVTATANGYTKSADITITVEKIDLANATVTINPWHADGKFRFYPYASETAALSFLSVVTVTANGEKYKLSDGDYTYTGATATQVGKYTLTITAKNSCAKFKGSKVIPWEVIPHQLYRPVFQGSQTYTKTYDGTTTLPGSYTWLAEFYGKEGIDQNVTLKSGDYEVTAAEFVSADAGENKPINQTITLKNENFVFSPTEIIKIPGITTTDKTLTYKNFTPKEAYPTGGTTFNIEKADAPTAQEGTLKVINDHADTYTVDLAALLPKLTGPMKYGDVAYALGKDAISFSADGYYKEGTAKIEGGKLILPIQAAAEKKEGSIGKIAVTVSSTNIEDFALTIHVSATNKTIPTGGGSSSGGGGSSSSDRDNSGSTGKTETTTKPDGSTVKTETRADGTTVKTETKKDGSVTKTATKTETKPDGTKAETKSETVTNKDGSKVESETRTETKKDGTVTESKTETITSKDGTKSETKSETKTDKNGVTSGTETTKTTTANGSTGMTVTTIENGESKTAAETTLSGKAIEDAKKNGEAVKAPVEVKATRNSSTAPTVKVELPKNSGDTKVEIPVSNVKPGTVAVLVHPDGTEEIVKNSLPTEDGIQLTVNGGATVKIVDNAKDFIDTRAHWAKDAIDFVSARGLVNGMNAVAYAPNASTTRAQLWTILARQNDADLTGGATWFENAQNWAKAKGISDGANPNAAINRAQMVTMLWRTMGQPTAGGTANFTDVPADSYYAQAVAWAVENGITTGTGNGKFSPDNTCTRAQIAVFLYRNYQSK